MMGGLHTLDNYLDLPVRELAVRLSRRELRAETVVRAALDRIDVRDSGVDAWQHVGRHTAIAQARHLDAGPVTGALHGVPLGVKDLMDTANMPSTYGSPIYATHRLSLA